ncbi:MAG TPA: alcohol dehydrogenase [Planctomycetaceae bacterium]|nr:alcohol dehydrogenase [Planctomycetaceae bacterium]HBC63874.1 alcohol dehydrogenase [Planctomycetaceae bacterium]
MLAGLLAAPRRIQLIEIPEPELPTAEDAPGMILFQPEMTCLCGSDLPYFDGEFEGHPIEYPQPVGMSLHEMVGTVIDTNGSRWKRGQRVLAVPLGQQGLFERFVLPETRAVALHPGLSDEMAMLAQPFGTVVHALKKLPNMIDRDVVVLGQGPIGQMFNAGLRNLGARRIIGVDPLASRLRASLQMGATATVCARGIDAEQAIRDHLDGLLPEFVIEAVGHRAQAFNDAVRLVREYGIVLFFGVPPHTIDGTTLRALMWKNGTLLTSLHPDFERTFPLAMQWIAEGRVNLAPLLTHRFDLSDLQQAFDVFRDRTDGALKVLVQFPALAAKNR